uniref:ThiF family adenylyltransferase n=1 Tax=Paenibacillus sp. FSL H8-0079 TaxID=2921375 RepID=UPI00403F98EA
MDDVDEVIQECDIVVKAIDTPVESYSWVNKVCVDKKIPYISGGFIDYIGVYGPTYIPNKNPMRCL